MTNSQRFRCLAKYCRPSDHLPSPRVTNEPPYVVHCTPDKIACRRTPRASEHPEKGDERKGKIRHGNGEQAKEGYGRRGVPAGPEVDGHVGEPGGEKGEIEERGQALAIDELCIGTVWLGKPYQEHERRGRGAKCSPLYGSRTRTLRACCCSACCFVGEYETRMIQIISKRLALYI